jgi:hypothetical protein
VIASGHVSFARCNSFKYVAARAATAFVTRSASALLVLNHADTHNRVGG